MGLDAGAHCRADRDHRVIAGRYCGASFAAHESGVSALATIAAVGEPARMVDQLGVAEREAWRRNDSYLFHGMRLRYSFLQDVEQIDVLAAVRQIRCPLLITHGTADAIVPCADAQAIASHAAVPTTLLRYEGADHRFSQPGERQMLLDDIASWMTQILRRTTGAEAAGGAVLTPSDLAGAGAGLRHCHQCGGGIGELERVGRRDTCLHCGADLHCCLNCEWYDPSLHNQCREPQSERQVDKERSNFCDFFHFRSKASTATTAADEARARLDALFGGGGRQ